MFKIIISCILLVLVVQAKDITYISFKKSIIDVITTNPDIKEKLGTLEASKYDRSQSVGNFLPTVDIKIKNADISDAKRNPPTNKTGYAQEDLIIKWNLFNGFMDHNNYKVMDSKYKSLLHATKQLTDDTILEFIKTYLLVIKNKLIMDDANANVKEYKLYINKERLKKKYGIHSTTTISKLENKYIAKQMNFQEITKRYYDSLYLLQKFILINEEQDLSEDEIDFPLDVDTVENLISLAMKFNSSLLQAKEDIITSKQNINKEYKAFSPIIDLTATKSKRDDYISGVGVTDEYTNETTVLLEAKINLFNGSKDYNSIKSKMAVHKQRKNKLVIVEDKLKYQVKLAWQKYMTNKLVLYYAKQSLKNTKTIYQNSKYDLEFAKVQPTTVLDNMDASETANSKMINSKYDLILSKYELLHSIGKIQSILSSGSK